MKAITKAVLGVGRLSFCSSHAGRSGMVCMGANAYSPPAASGSGSGGLRSGIVEPCRNFIFRLGARPRRNRGGVIASVLAFAGISAGRWPQRARHIAFAALAFAFLGTLVGPFKIAVGIGPQTRADLLLHVLLLLGLALGLVTTWHKRSEGPP
jgi:hypothetical protein